MRTPNTGKPSGNKDHRAGPSVNQPSRRDFLKVGGLSLVGFSLVGCGQGPGPFPSDSIKVIVPYGAGGGTDLEARSIAPFLQRHLGVSIIVENQPGADGRLGVNYFVRQEADGYTLAVYGIPSIILGELLYDTPYKVRDFTHIYAWIRENQVLVAAPGKWNDFDHFLQQGRQEKLSSGVPYLTSSSRLAGLVLERTAGVEFNWIPFGSSSSALAAVLGGHVDFSITAATSSLSLVQSDKLDALLVFAEERDPAYPNVPTPLEAGHSVHAMPIVRGAVAPPGLAEDRQRILEQGFESAVHDPDFLAQAAKAQVPVHPISSTEYRKLVENYYQDIEEYRDLLLTQAGQ